MVQSAFFSRRSGSSPSSILSLAANCSRLGQFLDAVSFGYFIRRFQDNATARGISTPTGARWHAQTVIRMLDRAGC